MITCIDLCNSDRSFLLKNQQFVQSSLVLISYEEKCHKQCSPLVHSGTKVNLPSEREKPINRPKKNRQSSILEDGTLLDRNLE